jgi:oxygen-dependent protoporphyrinogen oxidase
MTVPARDVDAVVVGGGITGMVAARELAMAGARVTIVEPHELGGKVRRSAFDGGLLDEAADAFLARVPEGVDLCRSLGLDGQLVSPAARNAYVWSHGALRPLPQGQVLGVPTDLDELSESGIVSIEGIEAAGRDITTPLEMPVDDPTIGEFLRGRLGDEVVDRLVDPLVGGINAGAVDHLSLAATVPQIDAAARSGAPSLIEACRAQRDQADPTAPVFFAPEGGMGALVAALATDLLERGVTVRRTAAVRLDDDDHGGWDVLTADGRPLRADAVVLATPAWVTGALLQLDAAPAARWYLDTVEYASVALVALAVEPGSIERELDASGFLVPRVEGRDVTACSWTTSKWPHLHGDGTVWLRASVGRHRDESALHLPDDELVAHVAADLRDLMALHGPVREARVTRWWRSFPQYAPEHLRRTQILHEEGELSSPCLVMAGAAFEGLGVPACIRQGTNAARRVLATLAAPS